MKKVVGYCSLCGGNVVLVRFALRSSEKKCEICGAFEKLPNLPIIPMEKPYKNIPNTNNPPDIPNFRYSFWIR